MEKTGFKPRVKERELWMMKGQGIDAVEMTEVARERVKRWNEVDEWRRKLVPEIQWSISKSISRRKRWCRWMSESYKWWGASVAGRLNGDEVVQIRRLGGGEEFVSNWKELVFNTFTYYEPVKRAEDQSDVTSFGSFDTARASESWICCYLRFCEVVVKRIDRVWCWLNGSVLLFVVHSSAADVQHCESDTAVNKVENVSSESLCHDDVLSDVVALLVQRRRSCFSLLSDTPRLWRRVSLWVGC